jgi:subtilisin-like proprotein convertase family protein
MKKTLLLVASFMFMGVVNAQDEKMWSLDKSENKQVSKNIQRSSFPSDFILYKLDTDNLTKTLINANDRFSSKKGVKITIPNLAGTIEQFEVFEASNFEPALQAQYPNIRSYVGRSTSDTNAQLRLSVSPEGIQTTVFRAGAETEFMEPYSADAKTYALYKSNSNGKKGFDCSTIDEIAVTNKVLNQNLTQRSSNQSWKTMRLALSCTGEYGARFGSVAAALAQMNATMTRVNGVFEKDLAIHLNIIANNTAVIFTDATTDPYSDIITNTDGTTDAPPGWNSELQSTLTSIIGEANYDIGHLFGNDGGGGNAGCIGCVCVDGQKGSAYTSPGGGGAPIGDTFDIDYVAHEMGHQMGGNHTFSYGGTGTTPENTAVNIEPGSGSTIMGYAGITSVNVQNNSDDYFAYRSILQIQTNMATKTCPVSTAIANNPPTINAGLDYTIPKSTPFILTGAGSDINGNAITYCWEQNDDATTNSPTASLASPTKTNGPNFRSFKPVATPVRYMPEFSKVLSGALTSNYESVYSIAKAAVNFTLTGRDNAVGGYQTSTDAMVVTVSGTTGPFTVTSQNVQDSNWIRGANQTITWAVNNTNTLPGATNVDVLLSTDGGLTFPTVLIANTPNDGTEDVIAPNISAKRCRIMIKASGNIFYNVNTKPFAIGYTVTSSCASYPFTTPIAIIDSATYAVANINVTNTGEVSDVNLGFNITHTYMSDVQSEIISPAGTTVKTFERSCGATTGTRNLLFDDSGVAIVCTSTALQTVLPNQSLSAFNTQNQQGVWKLRIRDAFAGDTGTLNSARLDICTQTFTLANDEYEFSDFTLFPNPNSGMFNIKFTSLTSNDIKINIYDLRGRLILEKSYTNSGAFDQNINLDKVQSGVYIVSVLDGEKKTTKRIIVE